MKRVDKKNVVIYEPQSKYHVKGFPFLSTDFFLTPDNNLLFFVSTDTTGRYQLNEEKIEYSSSGLVNKISRFQERDHKIPFHGKVRGNPNTDIYYCVKLESGWTTPRLLNGVNSAFCERSPIYDSKNNYLYFSSEGFSGLGGFDIFKASVGLFGTEIKLIDAQIENVSEVNTPFDELFFNPIITPNMLSSNRSGADFDLFRLKEKKINKIDYTTPPTPDPPSPPTPPERKPNKPSPRVNETNDKYSSEEMQPLFTFDWKCYKDSNAQNDKKGFIMVTGNIYYSDSTSVKKAKIVFFDKDGNYYPFKTDENDNRYNVQIPYEAERYKVRVTVYNAEGDSIESETESFLKVCDNKGGTNRIRQDYLVPKKHQSGYYSTCPFFFDTDISNKTITNEKQARVYYRQDAEHYRYECIGFADIRGDSAYNHQLALYRAQFARQFLLQVLDVNSTDISVQSRGATNYFSNQDIKNYGNILEFSANTSNLTRYEIELLLNRRVEIKKMKKYLTEEK